MCLVSYLCSIPNPLVRLAQSGKSIRLREFLVDFNQERNLVLS